jgi:two-component system, sensor histidine kinase RegB
MIRQMSSQRRAPSLDELEIALGRMALLAHIDVMSTEIEIRDRRLPQRLRLSTLIRLRWLAVGGQTAAVLFVAYWLEFPFPVGTCLALIAVAALLNLFLAWRYPPAALLTSKSAFVILAFDVLQLAGLLYMTGGLTNPFASLMIVPAIISATSMPKQLTGILAAIVTTCVAVLAFFHLPLPWYDGAVLATPLVLVIGILASVIASLVFTSVYVWRVAEEARLLAGALTATELVLQREQHISALDGLAAAAAHELGTPLATIALVAKELDLAMDKSNEHKEDIELIRSQAQRCREILQKLSNRSIDSEGHLSKSPLSSIVEEVIDPHRHFGITIQSVPGEQTGLEPVLARNPGLSYGLGNLVENAVDFAKSSVTIESGWNDAEIILRIVDDGPGFPPDILDRIGEPYAQSRFRTERNGGGGLGLGLFITKTLLERSGAVLKFNNSPHLGFGAQVLIRWPRKTMDIGGS